MTWTLVRLGVWLTGAAVVFGLLMLASLWFAIPFAIAFVSAFVAWCRIALRLRRGFVRMREWRTQPAVKRNA
jgi:hypothetical protein